MAEVEIEVIHTEELVDSPPMERRSTTSSYSNSPFKSLPFSPQIVPELKFSNVRFSSNYSSHLTDQLPTNEIEEEEYSGEKEKAQSGAKCSSEEVEEGIQVTRSPLTKKAMLVTYTHSHSPSPSPFSSSPAPPLTPMPPPSASLQVEEAKRKFREDKRVSERMRETKRRERPSLRGMSMGNI